VDDAERDALVLRIDDQGWDQGCLVDMRHWVFIANADAPTSSLGAQVARQQGLDSGLFVAHVEPEEQVGVIVTSHRCDLVADPAAEPFCEAMPLVHVAAGQPLPQPNSRRGFVIDAEQRLVADGTYRLQFEKSLLPDEDVTQLLDDTRKRLFAAWLARRYSRAPFPNDFVASVGRTIEWVWRKKRFATSPVSRHLYPWRVGIYGDDEDHIDFLIPYDEQAIDQASANAFVEDFFDEVRFQLPTQAAKARDYEAAHGGGGSIRGYTIGSVRARPANHVNLRQMLLMPPLNLEHVTYRSDSILSAESHLEWEG
jgi:hypothetical protein